MDSFNEKVVENLKNEVEYLNHSLARARESGNFSMYKNLINSYRETVMLINELSENKKCKSNIIQTSDKIIMQVENRQLTTENNEVIIDKNGINIKNTNGINIKNKIDYWKTDEYKIRCAIEKEIEECINKIEFEYKDYIEHFRVARTIGERYDVTFFITNEDILEQFKQAISNILEKITLKRFIGDIRGYVKEYNENKIFCEECKKQLNKKDFYKIDNSEYPICKNCLRKMIRDENDEFDVDKFETILKDMKVEFIGSIFYSVIGNVIHKDYNIIGDYLRKYLPYKLTQKIE
ncbi:hypothetical protein RSJ19_01290 (plasmid) [Clostridium botulinum]|uniref:hypothetical protein n=1 Tax=Clostridium botulinum TaxID=1491 RepID=UPI000C76821A|nr:hypothetical protein [Clostridium botulinum]AUN01639.1 hypothetical protein RSJ19_01290 [Clostridium botulinum]